MVWFKRVGIFVISIRLRLLYMRVYSNMQRDGIYNGSVSIDMVHCKCFFERNSYVYDLNTFGMISFTVPIYMYVITTCTFMCNHIKLT